ncbi:MAG: Lysine-sensitive aspartokinase 3 [Bacteroidetes bacterium MED-G17]|nr:MAG: Lysine-sensitive aspartokinase 3 [Bacteroidetes bacterium MED-G17]
MNVFKFGGASVKSGLAVKNVAKIIQEHKNDSLLVVVSAMGKTTNMLENLVEAVFNESKNKQSIFNEIKVFHEEIMAGLVENSTRYFFEVENLFIELECQLDTELSDISYVELYDRIVPFGELISTKIINTFLNASGISTRWIDARNFIKTDQKFSKASVNWYATKELIEKRLKPIVNRQIVVTQGFIGRSSLGLSTTLGREGSDYSASIFAYGLDASSVTIWKDVLGVYNADPKQLDSAELIPQIGFQQAIELAYYGASVIHPKTIQPLQEKQIPLYVKSFVERELSGTLVSEKNNLELPSCIIFKDKQALLDFKTKDFSFIVENHMTHIFQVFSDLGISVNLIQNSAISFRCIVDDEPKLFENLAEIFKDKFSVRVTSTHRLLTIYNYTNGAEEKYLEDKKVLLEQKSLITAQFLFS